MSIKTVFRSMIVIGCVAALPMFAQTATTTTKTETKAEKKVQKSVSPKRAHANVLLEDATRLAAVLQDAQTQVKLSEATWKIIANESSSIARKLHAAAKGSMKQPAAEAQKHVNEMRAAALKGDAATARTHAAMALPYLYKIIDASAPSSTKSSHM